MVGHNISSKNKKILIIPDIHHKYEIAEDIIKRNKPAYTIFLGDYFDDFDDDDVNFTRNTAKWLEKSLLDKTRIHLIGNHDIQYISKNPSLKCSGFTRIKQSIIDQSNINWSKLLMYCWIDSSWLCTHAGLSYDFLLDIKKDGGEDIKKILNNSWDDKNMSKLTKEFYHRFFDISQQKGGTADVGGPLWCDYMEFVTIPNVKQIFGHTPDPEIRYSNNGEGAEYYCIDTKLSKYVVMKDSRVTIVDADDTY